MKRTAFPLLTMILSLVLVQTGLAQQVELEKKLSELPGVRFEQQSQPEAGFQASYKLFVTQPIDHQAPEKGSFEQLVHLSHRGFDRPMVMMTEGYARARARISEVAELLGANQLDIEHRYFGESCPDSMDYRHLNLRQATADLHRINTLLRQLYTGNWVSTGISKGGQTTIYYRYFYPEDVTVSIPYVAPHNLAYEDTRIYTWLDTMGTEACRTRVLDYQRRLLKKRKKLLKIARKIAEDKGLRYTYMSFEEAYEYAVLEFPFSLWQWGHSCDEIPGKKSSPTQHVDFLNEVAGFDFWSDKQIAQYGSHYYQAATEMGYYGYKTENFKGLLKVLPMQPHPHATFIPNKMEVKFDGALSRKVFEWLKTEGDRFIYIYGAHDTWTATGVPPSKDVDAHWFFLKDKHHGNARIASMTAAERKQMVEALERWLGMDIE